MRHFALLAMLVLIMSAVAPAQPTPAVSDLGRQDLFGPWQVHAVPDDPAQADPKALDGAKWSQIDAPFMLPHVKGLERGVAERVHFAWARREFIAPTDTAFRNAVLHMHGVRWGAKVWLNGQEVGEFIGGYGAFEFDITDKLKWGEKNVLLVRMLGWPQVPMSEQDDPKHVGKTPLIPHGSAMFRWGNRSPGIAGGVWVDYFDYARLEQVLVEPAWSSKKLGPSTVRGIDTVRIRGSMRNYTRMFGNRVIRPSVLLDGKVIATQPDIPVPWPNTSFGRTAFDFDFCMKVKMAAQWSTTYPYLYQMQLDIVQDGRLLHRWRENFGFRTFGITRGMTEWSEQVTPEGTESHLEVTHTGFYLNGQRIFLRGICTWGQNVGWPAAKTTDPKVIQHFMVDLQRAANLNCIRNHTVPLDGVWLDVADRTGYMVLQEFPITMNYRSPAFTPAERELYHKRCLDEFRSLLPLYWNHPSVVMWVPTNESGFDTEWENGELYQMFKKADPSRPIMRTSEESPDIFDTHCYDGFWNGPEGKFALTVAAQAARGRASGKPLTNTEYIENFRVGKWMGPKPADVSDEQWRQRVAEGNAQFILEQTEVLRRLGFDGTLPYAWSAGYVGNLDDPDKQPEFKPNFYALRSGQSPLLASLDLADRHFVVGSKLDVPIVLCDDTGKADKVDVDVLLVAGDPGFVWPSENKDIKIVWRNKLNFVRNPDLLEEKIDPYRLTRNVAMPLPKDPGGYWLLAVVKPEGRPAAVSRRPIDVVPAPDWTRLAGRKIAIIAGHAAMLDTLKQKAPGAKLGAASPLPNPPPEGRENAAATLAAANVVLVGPMAHRQAETLSNIAGELNKFAESGGRVVVLEQDRSIPALGLEVRRRDGYGGSSTAFRPASRPVLGPGQCDPFAGLGDDSRLLRRFNGPTGAVVRLPITTRPDDEALVRAAQEGNELNWVVIARRTVGNGEIIFCQMPLAEHLAGENADTVAQQILINLLSPADRK